MTRRLDHAQRLLASLGGPAQRPTFEAARAAKRQKGSQFGQCTCGEQVIWSNLPSGARACFDFNDAGDLCLVDGVMVEWGPLHGEHKRRFSLHFATCKERGAQP